MAGGLGAYLTLPARQVLRVSGEGLAEGSGLLLGEAGEERLPGPGGVEAGGDSPGGV